jgi:curved DNA-binding protein CbpA
MELASPSRAHSEAASFLDMDTWDLYKTLQVDADADPDVIRAAYRVLAAKNHPDVGGSAERMSAINQAWTTLSDPAARAVYDRERRLRTNGERWDAYANAATMSQDRANGTVIDYGRYAGWSIPEVARRDPDFLEWLGRTPLGRRYRAEIDENLSKMYPAATAVAEPPRRRSRFAPR